MKGAMLPRHVSEDVVGLAGDWRVVTGESLGCPDAIGEEQRKTASMSPRLVDLVVAVQHGSSSEDRPTGWVGVVVTRDGVSEHFWNHRRRKI